MKTSNMKDLQSLAHYKVLSKHMAEKSAGSGLTLSHLHTAHRRGGYEAIENLLSEKFHDKIRLTKSKRVIHELSAYFDNN